VLNKQATYGVAKIVATGICVATAQDIHCGFKAPPQFILVNDPCGAGVDMMVLVAILIALRLVVQLLGGQDLEGDFPLNVICHFFLCFDDCYCGFCVVRANRIKAIASFHSSMVITLVTISSFSVYWSPSVGGRFCGSVLSLITETILVILTLARTFAIAG